MAELLMNVKVTIPVSYGGYTGQRDQWQDYTKDFAVFVEDGVVTLERTGAIYGSVSKIRFSCKELETALEFLSRNKEVT